MRVRMRKGIVAIVPLFFAIIMLFGFIAFMGGAGDSLHTVNNVENLQHLQTKLFQPAIKYRYSLEKEARKNGTIITEEEIDEKVNIYINKMMTLNKIQK